MEDLSPVSYIFPNVNFILLILGVLFFSPAIWGFNTEIWQSRHITEFQRDKKHEQSDNQTLVNKPTV